jgi:hypothetical protein
MRVTTGGNDEGVGDQRFLKARHLWKCRLAVRGTAAERYLREARGYRGPLPETVGYLLSGVYPQHALIAAFGLAHEPEPGHYVIHDAAVQAIHLTRLSPDGSGKAGTNRDKLMMGAVSGAPLCLHPPNDLLGLVVTEGIEDALSAAEATGLGAWAAGSAGHLPKLAPVVPNWMDAVTILAHDDPAGQAGAAAFASRLRERGLNVLVATLPFQGHRS